MLLKLEVNGKTSHLFPERRKSQRESDPLSISMRITGITQLHRSPLFIWKKQAHIYIAPARLFIEGRTHMVGSMAKSEAEMRSKFIEKQRFRHSNAH